VKQFTRITNNETGEYIQVGPDLDQPGFIEIASFDSTGDIVNNLAIPAPQAVFLAEAITDVAPFIPFP
jgi:hypothetical protein